MAGAAAHAQTPDDEEPLDLGLPEDDEVVPDEESPPDEEPEPEVVIRDPKAAKKLADGAAKIVKKGDKLAKKKKTDEANAEYERALVAYDRSFELNPDAKILVITAGLEEKFSRWYEARERYLRALAETEIPLDAKMRAKATTGLDSVTSYLGIVTLVILPEGASVMLEGNEIGPAPLASPLVLKPGEYTLAVTADGFLPLETKLVIDAGSESERSFELEAEPVREVAPYVPPPPELPRLPPPPSRLPLLIGAGGTLLFTIGAVTTGILAVGKHSTFDDPASSDAERADAQSSGRTMAYLTDAFTTVALVGAGITVYYYLKVYRPKVKDHEQLERDRESSQTEMTKRERRAAPKVVLVPAVQGDGGGLVLAGWF